LHFIFHFRRWSEVTDKNFKPLLHLYLVQSIIPENLVTLSFTVSEKNAWQRNVLFGHIGRLEVKFEKMKKNMIVPMKKGPLWQFSFLQIQIDNRLINRGSWTSAYGIWNLWNSLSDLIFPEPWRGKYSNPVTNFINFICHMHEYKILFITHLSLIWLNACFNLFSISQSVWRGNFWLCYCLTSSIPLWRSL
jgi:hypothetical protein